MPLETEFVYDGCEMTELDFVGAMCSQMLASYDELKEEYMDKAYEGYNHAALEFITSGTGREDSDKISAGFADMLRAYSNIRSLERIKSGKIGEDSVLNYDDIKTLSEEYDSLEDMIQSDKYLFAFVQAPGKLSQENFEKVVPKYLENIGDQIDDRNDAITLLESSRRLDFEK